MIKRYASIQTLAEYLGMSKKWVYSHKKDFDAAVVLLNGSPIRPSRYDLDVVDRIVRSKDSLKTEEVSVLPIRKVGRL